MLQTLGDSNREVPFRTELVETALAAYRSGNGEKVLGKGISANVVEPGGLNVERVR